MSELWYILSEPFAFGFMREAFLIAALIAVPTGLLSCFLVLKGWALMGDAVSHAVLPGIVLAWALGLPPIIGAFGAGMLTSVSVGLITQSSRVKQDTVMGVVFSGMFGLGLVLYAALKPAFHLDQVLFGNILGIDRTELITTAVISVGVSGVLILKWRDFMLHAFDPAQARASGLRVNWLHYGLMSLLSLTIVATLSATGLVLAVGLLIGPGATAFLLTRRFGRMLWLAVAVCMGANIAGIWLAFMLDAAPAPTIILVLTALFVLALVRRNLEIRRITRAQATTAI